MKILLVNKFLYPNGGSETYIFTLGEELQRLGHEAEYFGMEHEGRIVGNHAQAYTADMDFHGGRLQKLLYPFRIIYSHEAKKKMRIVLEDFQPDAVHLNNINFQLTPSVIYAVKEYEKKRGEHIPILYTAHDYQWICPNHMMRIPSDGRICFDCRGGNFRQCTRNRCIHNSRIKSLLGTLEAGYYARRETYGLVDVIICPSQFMKNQLDTNPLLAEKTVMLHNFVDAQTSSTAAGEGEYVLYFGRYAQEKGAGTLLQAARALPDIPFVFAGSGELEQEIERVPNVKNMGFLQGEELHRLIAGARFSVYPSEWYENCPFSVMESQIYGTPVLASDLGGSGELIDAGSTGELFRGGDLQELTEHIRQLWDDPERCRRYREGCRQTNFDTAQEYCVKLLEMIEQCKAKKA